MMKKQDCDQRISGNCELFCVNNGCFKLLLWNRFFLSMFDLLIQLHRKCLSLKLPSARPNSAPVLRPTSAPHVRVHDPHICTSVNTTLDTSSESVLVVSLCTARGASEQSAFGGAAKHGSHLAVIDVASGAASPRASDHSSSVPSSQPSVETAFDAAKCETQFCSCIAPNEHAGSWPIISGNCELFCVNNGCFVCAVEQKNISE